MGFGFSIINYIFVYLITKMHYCIGDVGVKQWFIDAGVPMPTNCKEVGLTTAEDLKLLAPGVSYT